MKVPKWCITSTKYKITIRSQVFIRNSEESEKLRTKLDLHSLLILSNRFGFGSFAFEAFGQKNYI